VKKVPFLGSLPILGCHFRDTTTNKTKTNLLLFLTPYIIRDQSDYRRIYEKKRKEQEEFMEQFYGRRTEYEFAVDYSRKAGPYSKMRKDVLEETSHPENGGTGGPGERIIGPDAPSAAPPPPPRTTPLPDGSLEPLEVQPDVPPAGAPPEPPPPEAAPPPTPPGGPQP
jgi:general secretion pathway protein D